MAAVTIETEGNYAAEFLIGQINPIAKDDGVLLSGQNVLAGAVLGRVETAGVTSAIVGTGNGSIGTITAGAGVQEGVYVLKVLSVASNVANFEVRDPQGDVVGSGVTGVAFSGGGLSFTLADGSTDFIVGDVINITVAAGSKKWVAHDASLITGGQVASGIAYADYDASAADLNIVVVARLAEVDGDLIGWKAGISAGDKAAGIVALATKNIIVR